MNKQEVRARRSHNLIMEELQKTVLRNCSPSIVELLDFTAAVPYLCSNNLLTDENIRTLRNISISQHDKAQYLVYILPRKAEGWFGRFLDCLRQSSEGTSHADLIKELEVNLDDLKEINSSKQSAIGECAAANEVSSACCSGREEVYSMLLESPDNVCTIKVKSTESIGTMLDRISNTLNIDHPVKFNLVVGPQRLHERRAKNKN